MKVIVTVWELLGVVFAETVRLPVTMPLPLSVVYTGVVTGSLPTMKLWTGAPEGGSCGVAVLLKVPVTD
jgi:hypothetical protein